MRLALALAPLVATFILVVPHQPIAEAQESAAVFDAPVVVVDEFSRMQAILDIDGDGDTDAIGTWATDRDGLTIRSFVNDGRGRFDVGFRARLGDPMDASQVKVEVGRLDGDAVDDFAVNVGAEIRLYRGSATTLVGYATVFLLATVTNFELADFDGDGLDDLVVTYSGFAATYLNDGHGGFSLASLVQPWNATDLPQLFITEVNGDGLPDVGAVVTAASSTVFLWPMADGAFGEARVEFLVGVTDPMPASGDVDGDGDEDIVIFRMATYALLRREGPASFSLEAETPGGPATELADVDADGDLDGICCGGGGSAPPLENWKPSLFHVAINDGQGGFAPAFSMPGIGSYHVAGAADVDGDGDIDLVAGRCVYYSPGKIVDPYLLIPDAAILPDLIAPLVDVDGDGDVDAQFSLDACRSNRGDGTFTIDAVATTSAPPGGRFEGPGLPGDFDGDGDPDLLVIQESATTGEFVSMRLLRNRGDGRLVDGGDASTQRMFHRHASRAANLVTDVDSDGDLDVVGNPGDFSTEPVTTWLNDSYGSFTRLQSLPSERIIAVADLDGDGVEDAVTAFLDIPDGTLLSRLRLGVGGGWFGDPITLLVEDYGSGVRVADFDRDGDLDLITYVPPYRVLENEGGLFVPGPEFPTATDGPRFLNTVSLLLTDVNGDGRVDVIFAQRSGVSAICVQTSDGFELAARQMFVAAATADVDGDGDDDLLSQRYTVESISRDEPPMLFLSDRFILARRFEGPAAGSRRQYGTGLSGSGGFTPLLGAASSFRVGEPREYRIVGGLGGARAFLVIGRSETSTPHRGGTLLAEPWKVRKIRLGGPARVPGAGDFTLFQGPTPPPLSGRTFFLQAAALDPGAPEGLSLSNGLRVTFGG